MVFAACKWVLHRKCKEQISQHIKIMGFTKDNIKSYLETTIHNDPSLFADLQKYISFNPHINSLMYIPLNSAIVVEVYRNSRKDKTAQEEFLKWTLAGIILHLEWNSYQSFHLINKMETLDLNSNALDSESTATLTQLIPHMPHLKRHNLLHNPIWEGIVPLITSLATYTSLEKLSLGWVRNSVELDDCQTLDLSGLLSSLKELILSPSKAVL